MFEVLLGLQFSIKQVLIALGGELRAGWPQGPGLSVQPTSQERYLGFQIIDEHPRTLNCFRIFI